MSEARQWQYLHFISLLNTGGQKDAGCWWPCWYQLRMEDRPRMVNGEPSCQGCPGLGTCLYLYPLWGSSLVIASPITSASALLLLKWHNLLHYGNIIHSKIYHSTKVEIKGLYIFTNICFPLFQVSWVVVHYHLEMLSSEERMVDQLHSGCCIKVWSMVCTAK